ncbi:lasso RiPP family leader peptide-containing protein [Rhodococcus sp. BP-149]|nr:MULTISPECIES: keywimysin-related RiPP [unclassified Rhodococcus (in: high G+C Gram-positive bacteria)]MBY6687160.1 lasso RiPP family leader peptide-containing protein [Rhodococcus sp. BP-288]MBY6694417.1 lasso RiPP family leader peptide-containing protein [Rhodococcus sp. BP-188]MBY6698126.1 lasso RiPP family leader peptide-containing protein [Rhodococcus sp. BP-285]MBY6704346.1 lasso RiPP family leader peptide-containing protein [Rhodococcus sp. BP-283]MBY6706173.1 lasso RiPP family leader
MTDRYETPTIVDLGEFRTETGYGIGGQAEGWNPIADRKN